MLDRQPRTAPPDTPESVLPDIAVVCHGNPYYAIEGTANIVLDCEATGSPSGNFLYAWAPRRQTQDTERLENTDMPTPTFYVPDTVFRNARWEYVLTASANDAQPGAEDVTITVLDIGGNPPAAGNPEQSVSAESAELPETMRLAQNYPNPFNPSTEIKYELPAPSHVRLEVFDATGRSTRVLVDGMRPTGTHVVSFNAGDLSSGLYAYRLQAGGETITRKMTVIR